MFDSREEAQLKLAEWKTFVEEAVETREISGYKELLAVGDYLLNLVRDEEAAHQETVTERDIREDQIYWISRALGHEGEWSNRCDLGEDSMMLAQSIYQELQEYKKEVDGIGRYDNHDMIIVLQDRLKEKDREIEKLEKTNSDLVNAMDLCGPDVPVFLDAVQVYKESRRLAEDYSYLLQKFQHLRHRYGVLSKSHQEMSVDARALVRRLRVDGPSFPSWNRELAQLERVCKAEDK